MEKIFTTLTTDPIKYATFIIALVLAFIKIVEYSRDRIRFFVYPYNSYQDDRIFITNLSAFPVLILHWQLYWRKGLWPFYKYEPIHIYDDDDLYIDIPARTRHELNFEPPYDFKWDPKNRGKVKLYLQLHIAGKRRKPKFHVFTPYIKDEK